MIDRYDVLAIAGLAMLSVGLYLVSLPLALSVIGTLLLAAALYGAARKGSRK